MESQIDKKTRIEEPQSDKSAIVSIGEAVSLTASSSSTHMVLEQPELLEIILDHSIHDNNTKVRCKTICSIRLVNKKWLCTLATVLRQNKEPLYKLTLTKDNSLNASPIVQANEKLLDQFFITMKNRTEEQLPLFSLKIEKEYFKLENHASLLNCLTEYGTGLVQLQMRLPIFTAGFPGMFPNVKLPNLQKLQITFLNGTGSAIETYDWIPANQLYFIQFLLLGADSLKEFILPFTLAYPPHRFEYLALPQSVTKLELCGNLRFSDLQILAKHKFSNLLSLVVAPESFTAELFTAVMENLSDTLKTLHLRRLIKSYPGSPKLVNLVRFPKMKQLEALILFSNSVELEDGHPCVAECFPKLKVFQLFHQSTKMLQKWIQNTATMKSVNDVALHLVNASDSELNSNYTMPISLEILQRVHFVCPNISTLSLHVSASNHNGTCGLKYLFMEMTQLTSLKLVVSGSTSTPNSDHWDSILTGTPKKIIHDRRGKPESEDSVKSSWENRPSIRMLKALTKLSLEVDVHWSGSEGMSPLISDYTFSQALLKMPLLKSLEFAGRFVASQLMTAEWTKLGRKIEYTP